MKKGIIGKKIGMTQIFDENGNVIPVTVVEAGPCVVAQKKTTENDGYDAVQLGFMDAKAKQTTKAGDKVDVTGMTKGHGFSGVVKRWGCHKLRMTHGVGPVHRQPGSMGANSTPSRIYKNKRMAGQYGNVQVTVQNLKVVRIDTEKNLIAIKGAVPGAKDGIVFVRNSVKA